MKADMLPRFADTPTGVGLGLRASFMAEVEAGAADGQVPFFEISPENHMRRGGRTPARFGHITERFPILSHGLSMSIGGPDPYDDEYFATLREFLDRLGGERWHSDHLCFCGTDGRALHDLLPVPFTSAMAARMAARVREAADRLERPMLIENISYYMPLGASAMDEPQFVAEVAERADCGLMLDVNNVFVNSRNHGFDPLDWLRRVPLERVVQMHVAGHEFWDDRETVIVDTHGATVRGEVEALLAWVVERTGPVPVVLERDTNIPPLADLLAERAHLARIYDAALARRELSHGT